MFAIAFQAKTTAAVLALAAQFFVNQRLLDDGNNADCLPAALDSALRAVGHRVNSTTLARVRPDGTIAPGVTADVLRIDRKRGDSTFGELERLRIELTGGGGLSSGVSYGPDGLVRNPNGHQHGTPPAGIPAAIAAEHLSAHEVAASSRDVLQTLASGRRVIVMGGTVGAGSYSSCHATTAIGVDPQTHKVVVDDPESGPREWSPQALQAYFTPSAGNRTIFGCPSFAYEVDG